MKYLQTETYLGDNDCSEDAIQSTVQTEIRVEDLRRQIDVLDDATPTKARLSLVIERGYGLLTLNRFDEVWKPTRDALTLAIESGAWQEAVEACDILFQTEQPDALKALAHGIWLSVTFPVDPELSVAMLQHLIDESPDRSDGAAVAAATASYLVDLRASDDQRDNLQFFTMQLLGQVARKHSQVEEQEIFDFWVQQLELDDPEKFLPRLAKVLDVVTEGEWWFDRDALRARIPEET